MSLMKSSYPIKKDKRRPHTISLRIAIRPIPLAVLGIGVHIRLVMNYPLRKATGYPNHIKWSDQTPTRFTRNSTQFALSFCLVHISTQGVAGDRASAQQEFIDTVDR